MEGLPFGPERRGNVFDAYAIPNGAFTSVERSLHMHNRIMNDVKLRERLEIADKMKNDKMKRRGLKVKMINPHLDMIRRDKKAEDERVLIENARKVGEIMRNRIKDEGLNKSEETYERSKGID